MALVLDTGVLYAFLDADDPRHEPCAALIADTHERLLIPSPVLNELDYWVRKFSSAEAWLSFCDDVAGGAYAVVPLDSGSLLRAAERQVQYKDLPLDLTDAVVLTVCENLGEKKVATLDHRHFTVLRTSSGAPLDIVPVIER